jgi:hypothetical protein
VYRHYRKATIHYDLRGRRTAIGWRETKGRHKWKEGKENKE